MLANLNLIELFNFWHFVFGLFFVLLLRDITLLVVIDDILIGIVMFDESKRSERCV
jgi:hypothetical protein